MRAPTPSPLSAALVSVTDQANRQLSNRQLYELHHFAELGRLSASLLHEISNPLTAALLHLEQLPDQSSPNIRQARHNIQLLRRYVESARQQVRRNSQPASFRIQPQVSQLKRLLLPLARRTGVQLVISPVPDCRLFGDPVKFQQILANLIINAVDAYGEPGDGLARPVHVQLRASGHVLTVKVVDWGQGIAANNLPHIFEPFYSTKSLTGHGLGIGLSIVQQYAAQEFGATIRVTSSRRHGTQFSLKFPLG